MLRRDHSGFTLVELMIVVIVVGVLAGVAVPMYQVTAERSKASEATGALGSLHDLMRVHYAEYGSYADASFTDGAQVTVNGRLGMTDNDLYGRYFSTECYTFSGAPGANSFTLECDGAASTAPKGSEVSSIIVTIDESGEVTYTW